MPEDGELEALHAFFRLAAAARVPVLGVGANARMLVLDTRYDLPVQRITQDWDFAARFGSWAGYRDFAARLQAEGVFQKIAPHRFLHTGTRVQLDVVPFGGLADARGRITWPETERQMSVAGFAAAYEHAEEISLGGEVFRVTTPPWHVALKLMAYADRKLEKDLGDLDFILRHATEAFLERVFDELGDLLADERLGYDEAGAYLLGKDLATQAPGPVAPELLRVLGALLGDPDRLELRRHLLAFASYGRHEEALRTIVTRFEALRRGLRGDKHSVAARTSK